MFTYFAYGLIIKSDLPLPELVTGSNESSSNLYIRLGEIIWTPRKDIEKPHEATRGEMLFYYKGAGTFRVRGGVEIVVDPEPGAILSVLRVCLLGPVLAAALHQRGLMVLHASAISIGESAVAFLGGKGWGKSTLAAYLQGKHSLVADDIVAIDLSDGETIRVLPGYPHIKLWPNTIEYLGLDQQTMPKLQPELDKRGHRLSGEFPVDPIKLGQIYVLDMGDKVEIEGLDLQIAFMELIRHSYLVRYLDVTGATNTYFNFCSKIVKTIPVFSLTRPASLNLLPEIAELLKINIEQTVY